MLTPEEITDAISHQKAVAGGSVTNAEIYKAAEKGMCDKARYKMANMCAHGHEVIGTGKVAFLQRDRDRYLVSLNGDMFKLDKCL